MARNLGLDYAALTSEVETRIRSAYESARPALNGVSAAEPTREHFEPLHRAALAVGQMPPELSTLRARIGAILVAVVRRALFWYSPQIIRFQVGAAMEVERQYRLIQANAERILKQERALQSLALSAADENARLRSELAALAKELQKADAAASERDETLRRLEREIAMLKAQPPLPAERSDRMRTHRG